MTAHSSLRWTLAIVLFMVDESIAQNAFDPSQISSFGSSAQAQPLQSQQQTWTQDTPESKSNNENTNNMTPLDLNICSDANYRLVETLPGLRRSSEVRPLQLGQAGVIWPMSNRSIPFNADCNLQLSACSACLILISWNAPPTDIRSLSMPDQRQPSTAIDGDRKITSCETIWDFRDRSRCVDLRIIEPDADQTTLKPYQHVSLLNPPPEYRSQFTSSSYKLDLNLQFWRGDAESSNALRQLFPLKYVVIDNTKILRGRPSPADLPTNYSDGFISSPRFPKTYPEGVTVNYTLINEDPDGTVRLVFTDFRVHYMSILKVIDSNGQEIANTQSQYGSSQRPTALQSSGRALTVIFTANNYKHDIGFRANYRFVKEKAWLEQPSPKSCDKVYEDPGGTITIENLGLDAFTYVDCIWILEKPRYATVGFDKLYLKVEDFSVTSGGKGIELDVHVGRTSINRRLLTIFGPKSSEQLAREQPQEGFISESMLQTAFDKATTTLEEDDSDAGFYLRMRGYLGSSTGLHIAFAQFYRWATAICHDANEFHCDNGRCISNRYQCDNHDHCGDNSDENKCQNRKSEHGSKGRGSFAPGNDGDSESPSLPFGGYTTIILLVAGLIGLILVLLVITVIVIRIYRQKLIRRLTAATMATSASEGDGNDQNNEILNRLSSNVSGILNRTASGGLMVAMEDQVGSRPGPTVHQVGNRRLLVLPESEIGVLEAPPTYDDALKHPTVPPSVSASLLRTGQQVGTTTSPTAVENATASTSAPATSILAAPLSSEGAPPTFDNPAFDLGVDPASTVGPSVSHTRRSHRRTRRHIRSGNSTCSTSSSSESDGDTSGSCTDLETASDGEIIDSVRRAQTDQTATSSRSANQQLSHPRERVEANELNSPIVAPHSFQHQPFVEMRKPPVPLPRSSRTSRPPSSQGNFSTVSNERTENTDSLPSRSDWNRLNDTLV